MKKLKKPSGRAAPVAAPSPALASARANRGAISSAASDHALEEIRPAHRTEAAKEGVGHDDEGGDVHGNGGINVHDRVEQGAAGLDGGGGVDGVGHKKNDSAEDLQGLILAQEPVGQVLGDGDGIIGSDGEPAQPGRHEDPAHGVADAKANGDPGLPHAA